jgi:hypothetical protein
MGSCEQGKRSSPLREVMRLFNSRVLINLLRKLSFKEVASAEKRNILKKGSFHNLNT